MSSIRAVVVDPSVSGRLAIREVDYPSAKPNEAVVRVHAISLNRGEVRRASMAEAGWRPGWDLAGIVEKEAADGSGPRRGARVVGMVDFGAWAEVVAVPTANLAELPASVSFAQAATLPVAGLTALRTLEKGGLLLERRVLITGASGGVGHFACQLARNAGAHIVGVVRQASSEAIAEEAGAQQVVVSEDLSEAREFGPYDLILDSVGGHSLGNALSMIAPNGVCVNFGASEAPEVTFDIRRFYMTGGATLYGFYLFHELTHNPGAKDLGRLASMIAESRLRPRIDVEAPWTEIGDLVQKLMERRITGKAVLHLEN
ncbi:MAG TPA: zinc-binding dehydrogenase [Ktedonobacteraceae bacterium]